MKGRSSLSVMSLFVAGMTVLSVAAVSGGARAEESKPNEGLISGPLSRLRISGRAAVGVTGAQNSGAMAGPATRTDEVSFVIPEAKLDFNYDITENVAGRLRLSLNNAAFNSVDRFYIDVKNLFQQNWLNLRVGLFPVAFGEEFDLNNPVENWGLSTSAANVSGSDEGILLFGAHTFRHTAPFGQPIKMVWDFGLYNGEAGVRNDLTSAKSWSGRLGFFLSDAWYLSGSYYNTGKIANQAGWSTSPLAIAAGMNNAPTGTGRFWDRRMWELDAQWRFAIGNPDALKKPPRWSKAYDGLGQVAHSGFLRGTYGQFEDDPGAAGTTRREGDYWAVEGVYNLTPKIYLGSRYSEVDIDGAATAALNAVTITTDRNGAFTAWTSPNANSYSRVSIYGGYNLTERTNVKAEYAINNTRYPTAVVEPKDDYWALMLTTVF
jgi:hypothetical protein